MNTLTHCGGLWDKGLGWGPVEGLLCRTPPHTVSGAGGQAEGIQESPPQEYSEGSVLLPRGGWAGTDLGFYSNGSPCRARGARPGAVSSAVSLMPRTVLGIQKVLTNHNQLTGALDLMGYRWKQNAVLSHGPQPTCVGPSLYSWTKSCKSHSLSSHPGLHFLAVKRPV